MPPTHLRVDHGADPLGLLTTTPHFSWWLPTGAERQDAYRITADNGWDTGRVDGDATVLVPYTGPALVSRERVEWRVMTWTDAGEDPWSEPAWFETGLLTAADWTARWVGPSIEPSAPAGDRPATLIRCEFDVSEADLDPGRPARLSFTAHGLVEVFLNGARVGDAELVPGFTQYRERLQVRTEDVAGLIRPGRNAIGVLLADGWFRGQVGALRASDQWGDQVAVLAQLDLGDTVGVGTDEGWRATTAHVLTADLIAGERVDLRRLPRGWDLPGFDDAGWAPVAVRDTGDLGLDRLVDSPAPPVRRVEELAPVSVTRLAADVHVVDLGQNVNGWVRLSQLGPEGTEITLTHGEHLTPDGDVTTDHLRPDFPFLPAPLLAGQVDQVVSAGLPGDVFEPRHTTHGFRYVRVEGLAEPLDPEAVRGVVVHTDLTRTGWFACSDERLNALHEAVVWSLRDNACDIPTDCPQRERAGWTGDWATFLPTAVRLYDVAGFTTKWLRDVRADQWADGTVANISPSPPAEGEHGPAGMLNGSAGWGDAVVTVPWLLHRHYGDLDIVAETWPAMTAWVDRAVSQAAGRRHPARAAARPDPAPHERYLWDTGFHWGEWLVPGERPDDLPSMLAADHGDVATAYLARSADLMRRMAALLGRPDEADRYAALHRSARDAWRAEYLAADGRLTPDTQANHVRALAFGLMPDADRCRVADRLAALVRDAGTHLATGFLSTGDLLPQLALHGHTDLAYALLQQRSTPSWLGMLDRGATTMWEWWDGVDDHGVARGSLNHYAKGSVAAFLHEHVGGLRALTPTYRQMLVEPRPGGGLTAAETALDTPHGRAGVRWERDRPQAAEVRLEVTVPPGTTARLVLPDQAVATLRPGRHSRRFRVRPEPAEPRRDSHLTPDLATTQEPT